jgi:hypothetical protein
VATPGAVRGAARVDLAAGKLIVLATAVALARQTAAVTAASVAWTICENADRSLSDACFVLGVRESPTPRAVRALVVLSGSRDPIPCALSRVREGESRQTSSIGRFCALWDVKSTNR